MLALCQFNARLSSLSITHTSAELFLLFINAAAGVPGGGAGRCNFSCTADTDSVCPRLRCRQAKTLSYLCLVDKNLHSASLLYRLPLHTWFSPLSSDAHTETECSSPVANLSASSLQLHCMQFLMLCTRIDYEEMSIALKYSHYCSLIITVAV